MRRNGNIKNDLYNRTEKISIFTYILVFCCIINSAVTFDLFGINFNAFRITLPFVTLYALWNKTQFEKFDVNLLKFLGVWFVAAVITACIGSEVNSAFNGLVNYVLMFVAMTIFIIMIKNAIQLDKIIILISVIMIVFSLWGYFEAITGKYICNVQPGVESVITEYGYHYPVTIFFNPNDLVFFVMAVIPFLYGTIHRKRSVCKKKQKFFWALYFGLYVINSIILGIFASSRMSIVVILFFVTSYLLLHKKKTVTIPILVISAALFFILLFARGFDFEQILNDGRVGIWKDALNNLIRSFGFGTGIGNANFHFEGVNYNSEIAKTHFWFLEVLCEFGIPFFVFLMSVLSILLFKAYRVCNDNDKIKSSLSKQAVMFMMCFIPLSMMSSSVGQHAFLWIYFSIMLLSLKFSNYNTEVASELVIDEKKAVYGGISYERKKNFNTVSGI